MGFNIDHDGPFDGHLAEGGAGVHQPIVVAVFRPLKGVEDAPARNEKVPDGAGGGVECEREGTEGGDGDCAGEGGDVDGFIDEPKVVAVVGYGAVGEDKVSVGGGGEGEDAALGMVGGGCVDYRPGLEDRPEAIITSHQQESG